MSNTPTNPKAPGIPTTDIVTNLANLLPTGTFLVFQALAPLFTNNGHCQRPEKIMTGLLVLFFIVLSFFLSFVDSVTTESGKVYYGIVTKRGLYNPQFRHANIKEDLFHDDLYFTGGPGRKDYKAHMSDLVYGVLNVITFGTLSCLTPPVTSCYYPDVPSVVVQTAPILVAMAVGVLYAFVPYPRHGVGFALTSSGFGFVPEQAPDSTSKPGDSSSSSSSDVNEQTQTADDPANGNYAPCACKVEDGISRAKSDSAIDEAKTGLLASSG